MITIATQAETRLSWTSETSAAVTSSLSGQRVHQLAERRGALAPAGDPAVQGVRDRRQDEHHGREGVPAARLLQQRGHEDRDQQDAQDREDVRQIELEHRAERYPETWLAFS
jgi:hypothetical protein